MLEAAIVLQLGLREFVEAGVVAFLLVFNAALGFIQEGGAQATLEALKSRLALAANGVPMRPLPIALLVGLLFAAAVFALLLDEVKLLLFRRLQIA